ncbi:hypothetical protein PGTUg99_050053 [Puccinia graminis f. sp. tritici]|uniref:Retrovirus-related Pol polyprotein from transposon TNT 1-94-like beta-barrel domain-containing protein n=1 Tax=Puccinia graminis f. sp. tritici TaxID=56615 RepID=A0A5B0SLM5_PUCGR|nr:hypothetical protein PGTUg99_050053 [Puccinia graminis f. sp. tritici]
MASVGIKMEGEDRHITESFVAENIVFKAPSKYDTTKDLLHSMRPLTIAIVQETFNNKRLDVSATGSVTIKSEDTALAASSSTKPKSKRREWCTGGKHNPKSGHTESECRHLANIRAAAKKAQAENSDAGKSQSTGNGLRCTIKAFAAISTPNLCYLDSGASHHMFTDKSLFKNYQSKISHVELADGNTIEVQGKGFVNVRAENNSVIPMKALHVPKLSATLISLGRLYERGCEIKRTGKSSFVLVREGEVIFKASIVGGTCMVHIIPTHEDAPVTVATTH